MGIRPLAPLKRGSSDQLAQVDWDAALREFVGRMKEIQWRHGPESIAVLAPARLVTEEWLLLRTLVEGTLSAKASAMLPAGTIASLRACQSAWDVPAPPGVFDEIETAETIVLVGTSLAQRQPHLWQRLLNNRLDPTVLVVDSRQSETVRWPGSLLVQPGSEADLFRGVARILVEQALVDPLDFTPETDSVSDFLDSLNSVDLAEVVRTTGLSLSAIVSLAETIGSSDRLSMWWPDDNPDLPEDLPSTMMNLSLLMSTASRAGGGANPLLSPWNVLGMCAAGVAGISKQELNTAFFPSLEALQESLGSKQIQALWILNSNAETTKLPDALQDSLHDLEFLVVQGNAVDPDVEAAADLILPTTTWGEKTGSFISAERRCGVLTAVDKPPGEALSDHEILVRLLDLWGEPAPGRSPAETFEHLTNLSRGTWWDLNSLGSPDDIRDRPGRQCGASRGTGNTSGPVSLWQQNDNAASHRPHFIVK